MKIALFGLPACGKGTQAKFLTDSYGFAQLSTGDMLRQMKAEPGELGEKLRALPPGTFADDQLIMAAVKKELLKEKYAAGVIFDGFPRTASQAEAMLDMGIELDAVIFFKADEESLISRGVNRRVHVASGRIYNLLSAPPEKDGLDNLTGEKLTWRDDDKEDVMRKRFRDFTNKTLPALGVLKSTCVAGSGPVYTEINAELPTTEVSSILDAELAAIAAVQNMRKNGQKCTVTLESPFAGDNERNIEYARAALRDSLLRGEACLASHLLYTQPGVLDDRLGAQRRLGIEAGLLVAEMTATTVVYHDLGISKGMHEGINRAKAAGRKVELRSLPAYNLAQEFQSEPRLNPNPEWCTQALMTVRSVVNKDLLGAEWRKESTYQMGHNYVASEALFHALGGQQRGYTPYRVSTEYGVHWFLRDAAGSVIDATWDSLEQVPEYATGVASKFDASPSDRAKALMLKVAWSTDYLQALAVSNKSSVMLDGQPSPSM